MGDKMIYIISDTHRPSIHSDRDGLLRMIANCRRNKGVIFLVGDNFDFWLREWSQLIATEADLIADILSMTEVWVPGNHDNELADLTVISDEVRKKLGVTAKVYYPYALIEVDGKKWLIEHGHREGCMGWFFKACEKIEKIRMFQKAFRWMTRNTAIHTGRKNELYQKSIKKTLKKKAKKLGAEVVLFGHTHQAELSEEDGITFVNAGTSLGGHTYALWSEGKFKLMK